MKYLYIKDQQKRIKFAKHEKNRIILKYLQNNTSLLLEQKIFLANKLKQQNKKTFQTKINNRCSITYRGRSTLSLFKLSRIRLRELLSLGLVPGYKKAVW